jgi:hypothetical protein
MIEYEGETLYNIAAGLGFIAYLLTNVLWLRVILVIGACFYIATGLVLGLGSMVGWHVGYALINLGHVILLLFNNSATGLPEPIKVLYSERFSSLKPREFKRLLKVNESVSPEPGRMLVDGEINRKLFLVTAGEAMVVKNGKKITHLGPGDFIGEMSTLTGKPVTADVIVTDGFQYAYWNKEDLDKMESRNLSLYNRFMMAVGHNLIEKLHLTTVTAAAHPKLEHATVNA